MIPILTGRNRSNASSSHLLGKKSWNVYNKDNIERVRRDEANAKAAEEAEEQRMQEVDSARRLAILRGETPPPIEHNDESAAPGAEADASRPSHSQGTSRRPRKRQGEDDTDFELRIAKERETAVSRAAAEARQATSSAPIVDRRGNIDLFGGDDKSRAHTEKNEEAEQEKTRKKHEYEDQYTMRFSNAGGKPGLDAPWYSADGNSKEQTQVMKNVWGRDDSQRKERDERRIVASDPLAMMKQGAAKMRELKQERKKMQEERARELRELTRDDERRERHAHRHRSRHRSRSPVSDERRRRRRSGEDEERSRHRHRDRERSRDRDRDGRRHRHGSRSRERDRRDRHRSDEKRHK